MCNINADPMTIYINATIGCDGLRKDFAKADHLKLYTPRTKLYFDMIVYSMSSDSY